jgi:hypothetical protein
LRKSRTSSSAVSTSSASTDRQASWESSEFIFWLLHGDHMWSDGFIVLRFLDSSVCIGHSR